MVVSLGWRRVSGALIETQPADDDDGLCHLRWRTCPSMLSCCGKAFKPYAHARIYADSMEDCPQCNRPLCPECRKEKLKPWNRCRACGKLAYTHKGSDTA